VAEYVDEIKGRILDALRFAGKALMNADPKRLFHNFLRFHWIFCALQSFNDGNFVAVLCQRYKVPDKNDEISKQVNRQSQKTSRVNEKWKRAHNVALITYKLPHTTGKLAATIGKLSYAYLSRS